MSEQRGRHLTPPDGWGNDALSHFQAAATQNEYAAFVHAPEWHQAFSSIAADLARCTQYAISTLLQSNDPAARSLFMTAHNQYLAAARLASSGQCVAAYPVGRAVVESALYGWYLATDATAATRWHNKPTDKKLLSNWSKEFKFSFLTGKLAGAHVDRAVWAKWLHQTAIDFGAHPNKEALYANMNHQRGDDGQSVLQMQFLHPQNKTALLANKFVLETGMFAISQFAMSFPHADRTLDLSKAAAAHALGLRSLIDGSGAIMKSDGA